MSLRSAMGVAIALCCLSPRPVAAGSGELPTSLRASLVWRVLAYDRRNSPAPHPLALVAAAEGPGAGWAREAAAALETAGSSGAVPLPIVSPGEGLQERLCALRVHAVLLAPGLAAERAEILRATRACDVLSFATTEEEVVAGVAIGLVARDGRPKVLVNLEAARAEGATLDAGLLRLAQLVKGVAQ